MIPADLSLLRALGTPTLTPDGRHAVVAVTGPDLDADEYTGQLWRVDVDGGGAPARVTRGHHDTAPTYSPDGRLLAFVRREPDGKPQLHVVEAGGGEPVRLTDAPLGVGSPRFSPDGTRIAYLARVPEEGRYVAGGDPAAEPPRHITEFTYRADDLGFTADRRRHVFVVDVPDLAGPTHDLPEPTQLTSGDVDVDAPEWLPTGDQLVAVAATHPGRHTDLRRDAVLIDARNAAPTLSLTDAAAGSPLHVARVQPDPAGRHLWFLADDLGPDGREFVAAQTSLYAALLRRGADGRVTGAEPPRRLTDPEVVGLSPDVLVVTGDDVLVAREHRGSMLLAVVPASAATASPPSAAAAAADPAGASAVEPRTLLDVPWVVGGAAAAAGRVVVSAAGPGTAGDLVRVDPRTGAEHTLTDFSAPLRATGRIRPMRELTATAPDGYPVHGWVVRPDPERFGAGPHPTILMVHGGPFTQYTGALFDEVQVAAEAGYAVLLCNPRGSSGYGAAHGRAIRNAFGTVDADDVLAFLDGALADPDLGLDPDATGVMGGSYGGYMAAWLTTRTDRFVAAIVERGFLDPVSFTGSSDIGWFFGLEYLGDTATPEGLASVGAQSPMAHVGQVSTPTLVIHSEQDWRCPVEQGQRWFVELKRRGVPAELLLFPGEGHELTRSGRPRHRQARSEHVLAWWARYLPV